MRNIFKFRSGRNSRSDVGVVEVYAKEQISGTVFGPRDAVEGTTVALYINDTQVLESAVEVGSDQGASFRIGMYDVWRFAQQADAISVRYADQPLPMPDGKPFQHPARNGKEDLGKLRERFAAGQYFDPSGRIKTRELPKDENHVWQDGVLNLYQEVDEVIEQVTGSQSFIFSGTLLGYVRDQGFIPHDKDMDCAYLSRKATAVEVAEEFAAVADALIAAGYSVTPKASCVSVRRTTGSAIMVDIAHLFIKPDGMVGFPFGRVGTQNVEPGVFLPITTGQLSGYRVGVPARPEQVVEHVYGEDWRTPDPGFKWSERRRSRDAQPLLNYSQRTRIAMDDFYSRPETTQPSDFAQWLVGSGHLPRLAVAYDLGCGNGRDLPELASAAAAVVGVERSDYAVRAATQHVAECEQVSVHQLDLLEPGLLAGLVAQRPADGARLFYLRFLLNGLTAAEQEALLGELRAVLRPGDMLALEHRTTEDQQLKKARFRSYRRFIDTQDFVASLKELGLEILHREEGTGLAPFEREDPVVVRLVAKLPETAS